jgi:DNA-directed RNA polymerase subunit RPC12/RpoP
MSIKDNLEHIHKNGLIEFVNNQYEKYHCSRCGEIISIHNRKCFKCDRILKLVEKD